MLRIPRAPTLLLALAAGLAGCGGSTHAGSPLPVTVTETVPASPPTQTARQPPSAQTAPTKTTTAATTTTPAQTRTGSAPAFAQPSGGTPAAAGGAGLEGAVAKLRGLGFAPLSTATYAPDQTLHVIVGARTGAAHAQQAFFFDADKYLGTDAAGVSGTISVTSHSDTDVTLSYGTYRSGDADCCPSGAPTSVRFQLDGGRLNALDSIPSAASRR